MKYPESYNVLILLGIVFFITPFFTLSISHIWWGFGFVPLLPVLLVVAFFLLPQMQYLPTVIISGWWYDLIAGSVGPVALLAVIISTVVLFGLAQLISSRSLLSDILIVAVLYAVWILSAWSLGIIVQKIVPTSPTPVINLTVLTIGLISVFLLQLFSRRYLLKDNVVPKALL